MTQLFMNEMAFKELTSPEPEEYLQMKKYGIGFTLEEYNMIVNVMKEEAEATREIIGQFMRYWKKFPVSSISEQDTTSYTSLLTNIHSLSVVIDHVIVCTQDANYPIRFTNAVMRSVKLKEKVDEFLKIPSCVRVISINNLESLQINKRRALEFASMFDTKMN